ncbi:mitochondrial fission factor homolog B isoform X2 [Pangasianodon hypophthalmus]|uniref:mitochondrial fission factor homolog B isoform X2 n=1 Tax=Pangasianodon hypophthalmus TaxID=310915 RepID=UPI0023073045|nr:mitochondrial fission factor homolog B isoform X2 [Pangasianodon hypophthalmus]
MNPALEKMNGAAFPSPTAEMAEMNRIHYELQYTEGISQRMRVPEMLKVAPYTGEEKDGGAANPGHDPVLHTAMMQVPDRIIVTGDHEDTQFSRPRDLDLIQSTPLETLSLKTPPRVLTLNERPLDFLEMEQPSEEVRTQSRARRERSVSENAAVRHNGQVPRNDSSVSPPSPSALRALSLRRPPDEGQGVSGARGVLSFLQSSTRRAYQQLLEVLDENQRRFALATLDTSMEGGEDLAVADATALRRQIIKLNRRLQLLEEENKERAKREMIMYSITVAFWLINSWVWLRR